MTAHLERESGAGRDSISLRIRSHPEWVTEVYEAIRRIAGKAFGDLSPFYTTLRSVPRPAAHDQMRLARITSTLAKVKRLPVLEPRIERAVPEPHGALDRGRS